MSRRGTKPGGAAFALVMFGGSMIFLVGTEIGLETFTSALFMLFCFAVVWMGLFRFGQLVLNRWK